MKQARLVVQLGVVCFCLVMAVGCPAEDEDTSDTPTASVPEATQAPTQPGGLSETETPIRARPTDISSRGGEIESLVNTMVRQVTLEDGTIYEETIPDLVFRTAGKPDAGRGYRVVARWLGDGKWHITIFMRVVDYSTDPPIPLDLRAEFHYDEEKDDLSAANGRALFALTGQDPCTADRPQSRYCPLDQEVRS